MRAVTGIQDKSNLVVLSAAVEALCRPIRTVEERIFEVTRGAVSLNKIGHVEIVVAVNGHVGRAACGTTADFIVAPRTTVGILVPKFVFFVVHMHDVNRSVAVNGDRWSNAAAVNVVDGVRGPRVSLPVVGDVLVRHVKEAASCNGDFFTAGRPSIDWTHAVGCGAFTSCVSLLRK